MADAKADKRSRATARKINQSDIARRAEVSISTVSRALSGAPGTRPEVRARIVEIANSLGYLPLEPSNAERVTVFLPMHPVTGGLHQVFQESLEGVREEAQEHGIELFPHLMPEQEITLSRSREIIETHGTANALLFYSDPPEDMADFFLSQGTLVLLNNIDPKMRFDSILPDNYSGSRLITEHVLAAGHRRVAYLVGNLRHNPTLRLAAFRDVLASRPDVKSEIINIGYDREETAYEYFRRHFAQHGKPDWSALICANDLMALGVLQAAIEAGLKVPADFSLAGFDNTGWSQLATPRLTTMNVDRREMGREAMRLLRRRMARPGAPVLTVLQGTELLEGTSVLPLTFGSQ